jgi:hypothetical protein
MGLGECRRLRERGAIYDTNPNPVNGPVEKTKPSWLEACAWRVSPDFGEQRAIYDTNPNPVNEKI